MTSRSWQEIYADKLVDAEKAVSCVKNGQTVYVGSGAGEPVLLMETLARMADQFWDIEVIHLTASQPETKLASPELIKHFRYNTFYVGRGLSNAVANGTADYTPMEIRQLPKAMAEGIIPIDIALIHVSPPDSSGMCSLGIAVDATKAAVEHAKLVIAQVNDHMPVTSGNSTIHVDCIDLLVEGHAPLVEVPPVELDPVSLTIGRYISSYITDGATLHFDRTPISAATMRYLDTKKDLGIHTDILTDEMLRLIRSGAVTNAKKTILRGKTVASMALGSKDLYKAVHRNESIVLLPIDYVNDPFVLSKNDNTISVHSIPEIELTGMPRIDKEHTTHVQNLPGSRDFICGARRSRGGFVIMALASTTPDGKQSRIVAKSAGGGVSFCRNEVDYVVTEYGVVNLFGLSIRERAIALISIAHPRFRRQLLEQAIELKYVREEQVIPPEKGCVYPHQYEFSHTFRDGSEVFFRPMQPGDARRLRRMFYRLSPEAKRSRYHGAVATLPDQEAQKIAAIDYSRDMAIVGLVGPRLNPRIIAEGRYLLNPANNMGEFDVVVAEDYQGKGIATFLANYLNKIAYARGLSGLYAEVIQQNAATIGLISKAWPTATKQYDSGYCTLTVQFPEEDVKRPKDSIIVYSGRFGDYSYGQGHPFQPDRARVALNLINRQGFLNEPWMRIEEPRMITRERLIESHNPMYIEALERANSGEWDESFLRFHLGGDECPIFPGLFDYILLYTSATATGVDLIADENANVVFNPLGGFHHASRSHAEGFCYVNDAIVAIDSFLARGFRVAYVDIDAHHGNGVQDAYYRDDRVLFISLHQSGKTLYPWSGFETEIGEDIGKGYTINVPLPEETDDEAFGMVFERIVPPALRLFVPSVVVVVVGADTHRSDPLSRLALTNNGMVRAIEMLRDRCPHFLMLGAGGYDVHSTTRAWCRMWAAINRIDSLPDYMLVMGGQFMGGQGISGADIVDMSYQLSGEKKDAILQELERIARFHEKHTLPVIGRRVRTGV
ncbi:MAG: GNAT family N-acetyltransferase [Deltaproteobacteria bacterium]|nr:GNAT family N-acetyltransferase [Deltaproteobacteria bacterium]